MWAKPNSAEASALTGITIAAPDDALRATTTIAGVAIVVISMGKDATLLVQNGQGWLASPPRIAERNPIGAGNSMVGGLVWALSRNFPLPDAQPVARRRLASRERRSARTRTWSASRLR